MKPTREGEAQLCSIGVVRSSLRTRAEAPRQGREGAPDAWLVLREEVAAGIDGMAVGDEIVVLTWLHQAHRDTLRVRPGNDPARPLTGVFATRSPDRPNPVGLHPVRVLEIAGTEIRVAPLEAIDGTPIVDIKPVLADRSAPRQGFHRVTPRIVALDAAGLVSFLREVFDATGDLVPGRPAEMRIGGSPVLVSPAEARAPFPAFLYVYVDDADATHRRAVAAGAASLQEPLDTSYGDRRAMLRDPYGNIWQIAQVLATR